MAEIVPVVSESLEAQVRALLPSQRGFGQDLQASNVIVPIIDLTATAEGTSVPTYQQQALAFGSQTAFSVSNATTSLISTAGFYRLVGVSSVEQDTGTRNNNFSMSDGIASKNIWSHIVPGSGTADSFSNIQFDLVVFLRSGDSLSAISSSAVTRIAGSYRQVADVNGNPVNPVGFTPQ